MDPQSKPFLVCTIVLFALAILGLVQGNIPVAIITGFFGVLGLLARSKGKKEIKKRDVKGGIRKDSSLVLLFK